jgi:class 3 adenylate cyclase/tetratricopeptide (TPR) repeat protein
MLFVDVSGFTALTEKLAARGKAGAEEITDVIGSVFGQLLEIACSYGGDMLKWGGDAVLLLYTGSDSATRATRSAVLMSRAMSRIGRFTTSSGQVKLGVSISAHSDQFDLYLLGGLHRELIVTGPAASLVAQLEATAESGEILVSPETASRLDPGVLGTEKGDGFLVTSAPETDAARTPDVAAVADLDIASLLPSEKARYLSDGGEPGEHRQATVAFLEFSGVDILTRDVGPGGVVAALDLIVSDVEEAAEHNGVLFHETDIGRDGGKIVLVGAVPVVRGNDAERVLRTLKEVASAHRPDSPIRLRAGVNAGRVFVFSHDFDVVGRRVFAITGDTMNLAARVMGRSHPDEVLATQAVLDRTRGSFDTEPLEPFMVKGKSEPVVASAIGAPRDVDALDVDKRSGGTFVGRDREIEEILTRAAAAANGHGSVIDIRGAPGIGKSRLVTEASERWDLATLRVVCDEYGSTTPYLPFRRIIRQLLGIAEDTPGDKAELRLRTVAKDLTPQMQPMLPLLADLVGIRIPSTREVDELDRRFRRRRLEQLVIELLRSYLTVGSALVIEDAHAIDEASASLLDGISLQVGELALLLLFTRNRETGVANLDAGTSHLVIELEPLGNEAATALAGSTAELPLPTSALATIVERAGGNPLFLRELLRTAAEAGGIDALPESIEPLLVAQIDQLPAFERQVLRAAAVLGPRFDSDLVVDLLDNRADVGEAAWSRLSEFIAPSGERWSFTHGLMRDAAYEGLSFKRRQELHSRAGGAIEKKAKDPADSAEVLSLHWLHAKNYERAWRYSRIAGDRAKLLWANADASTFYARAFDASRHLDVAKSEVRALTEALGDACELTGSYDQARVAYSNSRRLCDTDAGVDRARMLRKLGVLHEREAHYSSALSCYSKGRHLLSGTTRDDATERAELNLASAGVKSRQGRYRECIGFATEAAHEAKRADHQSGLAHALYLQHMMSVYLGDPTDELAYESIGIFEAIGDLVGQANVLNNLGIGAYYRGRWDEALDLYERSREARLRSGDVVGASTEENNIGEIMSDQGHLESARPMFASARTTWQAARYRIGEALATSNLGLLIARSGEVKRGRELIEQALGIFREINSQIYVAETQLRLASCSLLDGDLDTAVTEAHLLLHAVRGKPGLEQVEVSALRVLATAGALAENKDGSGSPDSQAMELLDEAIERAISMEAVYEAAIGLATRAALTSHSGDKSADDLVHAHEIFDRLGVTEVLISWCGAGEEPIYAFARKPQD